MLTSCALPNYTNNYHTPQCEELSHPQSRANCIANRDGVPTIEFDSNHHSEYNKTGNSTVRGQAFLRQKGGGVVTCAGSQVMLIPATPYFREAINMARAGQRKPILSPEAQDLRKTSTCDSQGNFSFSKVPAGKWFLVTEVSWIVAGLSQGGGLLEEITTDNDSVTEIIMSDANLVGR